MSWTAPRTWVAAETLTAALLNTHVRDNLLETAPAKVTTKGDMTVATAANSISRLAVGSNGAVLVADSAASTGVRWSSTAVTTGNSENVLVSNTMTASANSQYVTMLDVRGTFATATYTGLSLYVGLFAGGSITKTGTGTISTAYALYITPPTIATTNWALYVTAGNSVLGGTSSSVYIGDTSNANMTAGLTVNQGAATNEIISLKSSGTAHGITSQTETDTFGFIQQSGGIFMRGFSSGQWGVVVEGNITTENTTKSVAAKAAVMIAGQTKSGTSTTTMGANSNIVAVYTGVDTVRFILDSDGDSHQDVGTAWTNYDTYDDAQLLTALSVHVSRPDDPIRENFSEFLDMNRAALEDARLVTFNDDGHHFVNMSKLAMLHTGAIRQLSDRLQAALSRLELAERKLALIS